MGERATPVAVATRRQVLRSGLRLGLGAAATPALLAALAACGGAQQGGAPSQNGTLTWSRGDDLRTQDPQQIGGLMEGTIARVMYDPLLDVDAKGSQVKVLATSVTMAPDGLSYTFKLRPGVKFHDGSEFNADSVVFTFERLLSNPTFQHSSAFIGVVDKVRAVDSRTVRFDLAKPNPGLMASFNEPILAPSSFQKYGADFYKHGIGTGPFKYQSWTPNVRWVGDANRDYWASGVVKLGQIVFRPITETATRIAALQNGEVDVIDSLSGDQAAELAKDSNINVVRTPSTNEIVLTFNLRRAPFRDRKARLAVAYAIDKKTIVQDILKTGRLAGASIPSGTIGYDDKLFKTIVPYDEGKARAALTAAGVKPGTKISFKLNPAWFAKIKEAAEFIGNQLQKIGFVVDMQFLEPGAYTQARQSGDFDICVQEIGRANNPDVNLTTIYANATFGNFYKEINPDIVRMIGDARVELDHQRRDAAYRSIQKLIADDLPELILYQEEFIWGVRKRVTGFQPRVDSQTRVYACGVQSGT